MLALPLVSLLLRAPWASFAHLLRGTTVVSALALSLGTATAATLVALVLGVPLAWWLAAPHSRAWASIAGIVRALVTLPLVLPPVVGGVALLMAFGRMGVLGRPLGALGLSLPFTTAAVVLSQVFVAMPFLVVGVEGALAQRDVELEEAAETMGASAWQVFRHVTLPLAAPAVAAGTVLCWARALGEFGATITFAGNVPGRTQTTPLAVYLAMQDDPDAAVALSVVLLAVCTLVLVVLRGRWLGQLARLRG
ncbi:ABC transporter permease [Luteococcus sanguinis]